METNQIKKFACEARVRLIEGVKNAMLGFFDKKGNAHEVPVKVQGGCLYKGQPQGDAFYNNWVALNKQVELYGVKEVCETVAYTWFNRLVAIHILSKNGLAEPVLSFPNPRVRVPYIVEQARSGQISTAMSVAVRQQLNELLNDDNKTFEQFRILIEQYCRDNAVVNKCFGKIDDYSTMLLPTDILKEGELLDMLNTSDFISDEDYTKSELIGWLYQFYISEKKDEVFASFKNKHKAEAEDIPAATQIFTPNWIVKYMVQNSLGRIYLDSEPYSGIAGKMQYLVESEKSSEKFAWSDVKELTCADLSCGSGHILNECFDLLYEIYIEQGYSRKQAIEGIFAHNLVGVDLDTRAKQLATFALILKACQRDASFADAHVMPRVYDMPDPYPRKLDLREILPHFFLGGSQKMIEETIEAIKLMDEAKNLGSIMKFDISPATREAIAMRLSEFRSEGYEDLDGLFPYFDLLLALTEKYAAICMNPPYMGSGNMNAVLSKYVKDEYEEGKADLFSTFMILATDRLAKNGKYGMINMHSWMFLSSFEKLRNTILTHQHIDNLLHLGPRTFDELGGEVVQNAAFVITKCPPTSAGTYYRLVEGKNCADKERMFLEVSQLNNVYYPNIHQDNLKKIPGWLIGYWLSNAFLIAFEKGTQLRNIANVPKGLSTGCVDRFMRIWFECEFTKIDFCSDSCEVSLLRGYKWFPYAKGGSFRRWHGNLEYIVNWENDGYEVKNFVDEKGKQRSRPQNTPYYFNECLTYSAITSGKYSLRYLNKSIFGGGGDAIHSIQKSGLYNLLSFMNTKIAQSYLNIISPTLNFEVDHIKSLPIIDYDSTIVNEICKENIQISKQDWDAHETSWDFQENELIALAKQKRGEVGVYFDGDFVAKSTSLDVLFFEYETKWNNLFMQLHANEEELNRQFIDIYGLQDELTPDVPLDEVTILQQGEISIEHGRIVWHPDVVIKQLISYAVGCWFGRYRLDKPGLHIAHPEPTADEIVTYPYGKAELEIDDDGIMPILTADSSFADNACHRLRDFVRIAFGENNLQDNINYIEATLGKTLEAYFLKDFWKEHKKMYQNRPIYWLFSSKKGAFQCLVYMHRMNPYTVERVRSKYLLPHMEDLSNRIAELTNEAAMLTTAQRRTLDCLIKELDECREYHDRLHLVADKQIGFDLDDGVVVNYAKFGDVLAKIK